MLLMDCCTLSIEKLALSRQSPWIRCYYKATAFAWVTVCSQSKLALLHSSPEELHIDLIQFSWWPRVIDPYPRSCKVCQMVLEETCKRPSLKIPYGSLALLRFDKIKMTRGQGWWPRDFRKLVWFSCALYSEKSVQQ